MNGQAQNNPAASIAAAGWRAWVTEKRILEALFYPVIHWVRWWDFGLKRVDYEFVKKVWNPWIRSGQGQCFLAAISKHTAGVPDSCVLSEQRDQFVSYLDCQIPWIPNLTPRLWAWDDIRCFVKCSGWACVSIDEISTWELYHCVASTLLTQAVSDVPSATAQNRKVSGRLMGQRLQWWWRVLVSEVRKDEG